VNLMTRDNLRTATDAQVIYSAQLKARYRELQELREQVREAELAAAMSRNRWLASMRDDQLQ